MNPGPYTDVTKIDRPSREASNRYNFNYHLTDGTNRYIAFYKRRAVSESSDDVFYQTTSGDDGKLDNISYKFYRTPLLWWVIALANGIMNPLLIPVGTRLRIPSLATVHKELI